MVGKLTPDGQLSASRIPVLLRIHSSEQPNRSANAALSSTRSGRKEPVASTPARIVPPVMVPPPVRGLSYPQTPFPTSWPSREAPAAALGRGLRVPR